jgi:hypothetical protein
MPKQVRHDYNVILNSFQNPILDSKIHLTFACCRQDFWILTFICHLSFDI